MNIIERDLLYQIITNQSFAEYIIQRIDVGDFDDEVANQIYSAIIDLLYQGKPISKQTLLKYFYHKGPVDSKLVHFISKNLLLSV
ncbi:MAG: DnaB-like helicase N-terminal domain-containing protein [Sphaerochaetaceae bacterium]